MAMDAVILLTGGLDSTVLTYYAGGEYNLKGIFLYYSFPVQAKEIELARTLAKTRDFNLKVIDFSSYYKSFELHPISSMQYTIRYQPVIEILASLSAYSGVNTLLLGLLKHEDERLLPSKNEIEKSLKIKAITPFSKMEKYEVIKIGESLGVDFSKTWSCIVSGKLHCGCCMPCRDRKRAFKKAGIKDPTTYFFTQDPEYLDKEAKDRIKFYESYLKPFLKSTGEYSNDFIENFLEIEKPYTNDGT